MGWCLEVKVHTFKFDLKKIQIPDLIFKAATVFSPLFFKLS